jgi:hypothetical protein
MIVKFAQSLSFHTQARSKALQVGAAFSATQIRWIWIGSLVTLAVCSLLLAWFPLLRIDCLPSLNYNEGWNVYRQQMAAEGQPLYAHPPDLWITNYPFLSFHAIGAFGGAIGNMLLAGRIVAFASLVCIAVTCGVIVRIITGSVRGGLYGALCFFLWISTLSPDRRAMNDPEFLGIAFAGLGLLAYMKAPNSVSGSALSAFAFAMSMFIKHDVIALPLCVFIELLLVRNWKVLIAWIAVGLATAGCLLILTYILDGPYFIAHLLRSRDYSFRRAYWFVRTYFLHFGSCACLGLIAVALVRDTPSKRLVLLLIVLTNIVAFLFAGGDGVDFNIFFVPLIPTAISCAVAAVGLGQGGKQAWMPAILPLAVISLASIVAPDAFYVSAMQLLGLVAIIYLVVSIMLLVGRSLPALPWKGIGIIIGFAIPVLAGAEFTPSQFITDLDDQRHLPALTEAANRSIELLRATKKPVICEDILLCFDAGKPLDYDPYFVKDQVLTGQIPESRILALLASRHYGIIELDRSPDAAQPTKSEPLRFTAAFMRTLAGVYTTAELNDIYLLLAANK